MKLLDSRNRTWAFALLASALLLNGCQNDDNSDSGTSSTFDQISVPSGFDYATSRKISLDFSITNPDESSPYKYVTKVYTAPLASGGQLITAGTFSSASFEYTTSFNLPTTVSSLYSEVYLGSTLLYTATSDVSVSNSLVLAFGATSSKTASRKASYSLTGYVDISGSSGMNATDGDKYHIAEGTTFTGGINFNGSGTLYLAIDGTANFSYLNFNGTQLVVVLGANGSCSNFGEIKSNYYIKNYSSVISSQTIAGVLENYATANCASNLTINSSGQLKNYGSLNIAGALILDANSNFENEGSTTVAGDLTLNSSSTLDNNCSLVVSGNCMVNSNFNLGQGAYANVTGRSTLNSSAKVVLSADAYYKSGSVYCDKAFQGPTSGRAIVQHTSSVGGNARPYYTNNIYWIDGDGKDENSNELSFTIAASECSPGFGKEDDAEDEDGDGVTDDLDEYPTDKTRAFLIDSDSGTLMFEDKWPELGDYDFNDLVVGYKYAFETNADNEVVNLLVTFQVKAVGATFNNGFGFSIPVSDDKIASVTGWELTTGDISLNTNGTEAGHTTESTIIVYDQFETIGQLVNVNPSEASQTIDPIDIVIQFKGSVSVSDLVDVNPFLFINQDRSSEIHLPAYNPTDLASNTSSDYTSADGFPWALKVPADVDYMKEGLDFTTGYPDFIKWVESDDTSNKDWYETNVNQEVLY